MQRRTHAAMAELRLSADNEDTKNPDPQEKYCGVWNVPGKEIFESTNVGATLVVALVSSD